MIHKNALYAIDKTLQDLRRNRRLMGGVPVLLAGDFRQTLPIISKGTPADEVSACLRKSDFWKNVESRRLTTNMRARLQNAPTIAEFSRTLLAIGNGSIAADANGMIDMTQIGECVNNTNELFDKVYPDLAANVHDIEWLCSRALLAPKNDEVDKLNTLLLAQIDGEMKCYNSVDTVTDPEMATSFPVEFLNSLDLPGMPPHKLELKIGCPVILLRNLNAPILCNGTRLKIKTLHPNVIEAIIMTGQGKGKTTFIPKMPMIPSDSPYPIRRLQFPLRPSFAMTINKSQGQSLEVVGLHLQTQCFSHGQLYVACSRVGRPDKLFIYTPGNRAKNVVYKAALQ